VDAEGLFAVYVNKSGLPKLSFRIALHKDDLAVLEFLQKKLGTGIILKSSDTYVYYIQKSSDLYLILFPGLRPDFLLIQLNIKIILYLKQCFI
jgi:hypothetical protein